MRSFRRQPEPDEGRGLDCLRKAFIDEEWGSEWEVTGLLPARHSMMAAHWRHVFAFFSLGLTQPP
jgi:hypothetical protein